MQESSISAPQLSEFLITIETIPIRQFLRYYICDPLCSNRLIARKYDNSIMQQYEYLLEINQTTPHNEINNFAGYTRDLESAMDYLGLRYYNSSIYRFIQTDIINGDENNPQSCNKYIYSYNNPINKRDIMGGLATDIKILNCTYLNNPYCEPLISFLYAFQSPQKSKGKKQISEAEATLKIPPLPNTIKKPCIEHCNINKIQHSLESVNEQIDQIKQGKIPSGYIAAFVMTDALYDPSTGWNYPLEQDPKLFNPYFIDPTLTTDPCVKYCAIYHEWVHFNDLRPWNSKWSKNELIIYWEIPAYTKAKECLENFLKLK